MSANSASNGQGTGGSIGRRAVLTGGAVVGAAAVGALGVTGAATAAAATSAPTTNGKKNQARTTGVAKNVDGARVRFDRWTTHSDFQSGQSDGILPLPGKRLGVVIAQAVGTTSYTDPYLNTTTQYEYATWTSPVRRLDFGATQLTAHWNADTPKGTFLKVELLATMEDGHTDTWVMGIWTLDDSELDRT